MHVLLALYGLTFFRIKQVSGSQMISDNLLLLTLFPVRAGAKFRYIASEWNFKLHLLTRKSVFSQS